MNWFTLNNSNTGALLTSPIYGAVAISADEAAAGGGGTSLSVDSTASGKFS